MFWKALPRAGVPRPSTPNIINPLSTIERIQRGRPAPPHVPHLSATICPVGPPYTYTITGYFRVTSMSDGFMMNEFRSMPALDLIVKYSGLGSWYSSNSFVGFDSIIAIDREDNVETATTGGW